MRTTIDWEHGVSGNFNTNSDWNGGSAPASSDDADLSPSGTYTVTFGFLLRR